MMQKIIMLGTGHGFVYNCYNTCFLLQNDDEYFLIDTGGSAHIVQNLEKCITVFSFDVEIQIRVNSPSHSILLGGSRLFVIVHECCVLVLYQLFQTFICLINNLEKQRDLRLDGNVIKCTQNSGNSGSHFHGNVLVCLESK